LKTVTEPILRVTAAQLNAGQTLNAVLQAKTVNTQIDAQLLAATLRVT